MSKPLILDLKEKINGTVLYENETGTAGNITFANNLNVYKRLKIEYFDESSKSICVAEIPVKFNQLFTLLNFHAGETQTYLFVSKIKLESNLLIWNSNVRYLLSSGAVETIRKMFISKITGYTY